MTSSLVVFLFFYVTQIEIKITKDKCLMRMWEIIIFHLYIFPSVMKVVRNSIFRVELIM